MKKVIKRLASLATVMVLQFSLTSLNMPLLSATALNIATEEQLAETLENALDGDTITFISNITLTQELIINKAVTIDTRDYRLTVSAAKLICNAGTIKGSRSPVNVASGGCLELNSGAVVTAEKGDAVYSVGGIVHINGGTVNGAVSYNQGSDITIKGGSITNGLHLNRFDSFKFTGGIINNGIKAQNGTITFDGGAVKGEEYGVWAEDGLILNITSGSINVNQGIGIELLKGAEADVKGGAVNARYGVVLHDGSKIAVVTSYSSISGVYDNSFNMLVSPQSPIINTKIGSTQDVQISCLDGFNLNINQDTPSSLFAQKNGRNTFTVTPSMAGSFLLLLSNTSQGDFSVLLGVPVIVKRNSADSSSSSEFDLDLSNNFYQDAWKMIQEEFRFTPRPTIPETGAG
ncbi:hypothetical protein [Acetanaerobacterium elongatum]|uniref:Uncharacterized protein n=1 Tax=Acetanaerobacterium elongatum TaxID=258515 RepID=A0A1H0A4R6_9FIRM|nr:hypothetical protein [Acetanaerobacterium elongatum]SDN28435.1 hypothetical protein SAMN05192585_11528 [Acetanaerobacterium elongatum]